VAVFPCERRVFFEVETEAESDSEAESGAGAVSEPLRT